MEIRTLQYFLAVAREQNMTGAANMLHITQPTLSRQMADLEKELGKQLFIRTNRRTLLTEEGIRLRQRAEEIVSLVQQTKAEISDDQPELTGCIRIGAGETPVMHFLTDTFAKLQRKHPGITCELFTGNAITADTLSQIPLLVSSRTATATFDIRQWSQGSVTAEDLKVVGKFDLIANAAQLIRTGITSALGIDELFQLHTPDLAFVPLKPAVTFSCLVAWKKYQLLSPTCEAFLKGLKEEIHWQGKD